MREDSYEISTDPHRLDLARVHHWLSTDTYWASGRSLEKVRQAAAGSVNFGAYEADVAQIGYARVVTDSATFAWLCDVYVDRAARGRGVARRLVEAVRDHLAPYGLGRVLLATEDAHALYAKVGFAPLAHPDRFMVLGTQ